MSVKPREVSFENDPSLQVKKSNRPFLQPSNALKIIKAQGKIKTQPKVSTALMVGLTEYCKVFNRADDALHDKTTTDQGSIFLTSGGGVRAYF